MQSSKYKYEEFKKHVDIIKEKFTHENDGPVPTGMEVTFQAFLRYVISTKGTGDWHWDNVNKECHPCLYQPNIIVKTETAENLMSVKNVPILLVKLPCFILI